MNFAACQRDLRHALRSLRQRPGFLVTVVLTPVMPTPSCGRLRSGANASAAIRA